MSTTNGKKNNAKYSLICVLEKIIFMFKIRCLGKLDRNKLDPSLKKKQKISISICIENFLKNSNCLRNLGKEITFQYILIHSI